MPEVRSPINLSCSSKFLLFIAVRIPSSLNLITKEKYVRSEEVADSLEPSSMEVRSKSSTGDIHDTEAMDEKASKLSRIWKSLCFYVIDIFDWIIEWLERSSALYVAVVEDLKQQELAEKQCRVDTQATVEGGLVSRPERMDETQDTIGIRSESQEAGFDVSDQHETTLLEFPVEEGSSHETTKTPNVANEDDDQPIPDFESQLNVVAKKYRKRPVRFLEALKNALLAHAEFVIYFLVILNVVINGSVISLAYVSLLFAWGVFCIPWPTKTFWLSMIFYSMFVLVLKYAFQFYHIDYNDEDIQSKTGFSTPSVLGIVYYQHSSDFFKNAVWDMLLLIALLINRGLLKVKFYLHI